MLHGFLPNPDVVRNPAMLYIAIGILGATVMPHNLYLHSSIVQTRKYEQTPGGKWLANIWQGRFPKENTAGDGFAGTATGIGGSFNNIGGANRALIAALDASTGNATAWNPASAKRTASAS